MKLAKSILKKFTPFFQNSSFFLQGQMDINPKSRWNNASLRSETGGSIPKGMKTNVRSRTWNPGTIRAVT